MSVFKRNARGDIWPGPGVYWTILEYVEVLIGVYADRSEGYIADRSEGYMGVSNEQPAECSRSYIRPILRFTCFFLMYVSPHRSEGCARTGYFIPVRDGMEAGEV